MAGATTVVPDWEPVARRIRDEATDDWNDQAAVDRFTGKGGTFLRGHGRLTGPGEVGVGTQTFTARRAIVLSTGTRPQIPPIPGLADVPYWTNREAIEAKELPESLLVLGGGAIGVELAQVFARFGVQITVVEAADRLVPGEEPEAGALLARVLGAEGIEILTGARAAHVRHDGSRFTITLEGGREVGAERLLVATGRRADPAALGVETIGLDPRARWVDTDEHLRAAPGVWAVGDLTGRGAFTHVATYQAAIAIRSILGEAGPGAEYHAVPRVTFTDPEIGAVGLTEAQARDRGLSVRTGHTDLTASTRGWIHKAGNDGFIKLIEDTATGTLVGATSAGPSGGEVLSALTVAVHARVPVSTLRQMIYAFPTFHRAIESAINAITAY
ncbi:MAG: hypothetical protein JWN00_1489, partial [Actinomycetia bacterium]|nr:hypothetical protein [Actinomycetes bacterium]